MITITWPDGKTTSGETWRGLENEVWHQQWCRYGSRHAFRADMRKRGRVWSGRNPTVKITSKQFIKSLAESGMLTVTKERVQ